MPGKASDSGEIRVFSHSDTSIIDLIASIGHGMTPVVLVRLPVRHGCFSDKKRLLLIRLKARNVTGAGQPAA